MFNSPTLPSLIFKTTQIPSQEVIGKNVSTYFCRRHQSHRHQQQQMNHNIPLFNMKLSTIQLEL